MARRFATAYTQSCTPSTFQVSPWNQNNHVISGTAGGIHVTEESSRLYVAPACYSEVRKVIFWAAIRHEYTGVSTPVNVRLRVAPSSTSATTRVVDAPTFPQAGIYDVTAGAGSKWTVNRPTAEAAFYDPQNQNTIATTRFTTLNSEGSQLIYQEFDRFDASAADFFDDWDTVAALSDEDRHIAYTMGVQRTDGVSWINTGNTNQRNPIVLACGFSIVQAPSVNNRTRIYLPATESFLFTGAAIGTTYGGGRASFFIFHEDEWSGEMEARFILRQAPSGSPSGYFESQAFKADVGATTVTARTTQTFGSSGTTGKLWLARANDFFSSIVDGDALAVRSRSLTGSNQTVPHGCIEITLRGFNVMTSYFGCGHGPTTDAQIPGGTPAGGTRYHNASSLFDPIWFEDMESFRFLSSRVQGGILHLGSTITSSQQWISLNAQLDANVALSVLNTDITPECATGVNVASKWIIHDSDVTANNLINLAGARKLTEKFTGTWVGSGNDFPGTMMMAYVINVPNTEVVELGPLFDVGAFVADGCAATSAGLGEPPLLIISNGASVPKKFNPTAAGTDGEVEDAGIPVPFEGETPQAVPSDAAASPEGGLGLGTYRYRYTFRNCCTGKESDPNPEDIVVDTSGQSPAASVTFSFAGVRIPADTQICEICLYRTVEGGDFPIMAKVGCFNVDETSIFVDDKSDDALDFTNDGLSILNAPMPCVPIVVDYRNRIFGMGDIPNLAPEGRVSVVQGSNIIYGNGDVQWDRCLEGKFIKVGSDCRAYEISKVLPPEAGTSPPIARLKLVDDYEGATDGNLTYVICGRPNRLYFSEPLEPECWPAANFLDVEPGDGDRLMGAVSNFDRLVICKRHKTYVLTFAENPGLEVIVPTRISSDIGCIAPRSFAQVEDGSVWLADRGLAIFDGRSVRHIEESTMMNAIFVDPDNPNYIRRDRNGRVIEAVGVFYPKKQEYLLLLPSKNSNRGCDMMVVWDTKLRNITLFKFCQEFLSMTVAKDSEGNQRVYLGDTNGFVWLFDIGDTDGAGVPNATGTLRGTVTFAGVDSTTGASVLDDDSASFITGGIPGLAGLSGAAGFSGALGGGDVGLAGVCLYTRRRGADYEDPWTQRTIYAATSTRLYVTPQWGPDTPFDSTGEIEFEYMIGPIEMDWIFKPQNYGTDDMSKRDWRQIIVHAVEDFSSKLRVDLLPDFSMADPEDGTVVDPDTGETREGRTFLMDNSRGRQVRPVGRNIHFFMGVRMRNFAPEEPIRIINHLLCVEPRTSK